MGILRNAAFSLLLVLAATTTAAAQTAQAVIAQASRAMGIEQLNSILMWGSGASYQVGQHNNAEGPWPRTNLNDLNRWIDFNRPATRATTVTWAVPVTGGVAVQGAFSQSATPANLAWAQHL